MTHATDTDPTTRHPSERDLHSSRIAQYLAWINTIRHLALENYDDLWRWSTTEVDDFWRSIWEYFEITDHTPPGPVRQGTMPTVTWFPEESVNYAQYLLTKGGADPDRCALLAHSQTRDPIELTFGELTDQVARARAGLLRLGVGEGDRVVGYLPNIPEAIVAFLAAASIGAIWATCPPEFGSRSVIDRFEQLEPTVLIAVRGYQYGTTFVDRGEDLDRIRDGLPTLRHTVEIPYGTDTTPTSLAWSELLATHQSLQFTAVPFNHPLYVLFSSGTTGKPKAIVHGHGGILIEHLKNHALSWDLDTGGRLLWFTTTAWMMWNYMVSALLVGASAVLIDGNHAHPDLGAQWRLAERTRATVMGASPGYLSACRSAGINPGTDVDLSVLRQFGVVGSPLPPSDFDWLADQLGPDVLINVGSGGTDICTGLVAASPLHAVTADRMAGPCLGVAAAAFDEHGAPIIGEVGELVVTEPMPSMPVGFWNDPDDRRYHDSYFATYPGIWHHGDWITFYPDRSCTISGRSDATLNRGGVRLGTAEFYRVVEDIPEIADSLVVHTPDADAGPGELVVFVVLTPPEALDDALRDAIKAALRRELSPRHVPDAIIAMPGVPRTLTGKKLEVPVKKLLLGDAPEHVASRDSLADPSVLDAYIEYADHHSHTQAKTR